MRFALFDHVDRSDRPLARQLDERLEYVAAADAAGFYAYHVAEHHATPLNLVPVPGVYLGAVARATTRMRLGPLVYLLPLYSPLRLIEEIGILDHLSHGRLDVGVGRGVSPFELNYHKVDPDTSREVFVDPPDLPRQALLLRQRADRGEAAAAAPSAGLVSLVERGRGALGGRARPAFLDPRRGRACRPMRCRFQAGACEAWRSGRAEERD